MPVLEAVGRLCRAPNDPTFLALLVRQAPTWVVQIPWLVDDTTLETLQRRVMGVTRDRMYAGWPRPSKCSRPSVPSCW